VQDACGHGVDPARRLGRPTHTSGTNDWWAPTEGAETPPARTCRGAASASAPCRTPWRCGTR